MVLVVRLQTFRRLELEDFDPVERPPVGAGDRMKLSARFRQGDIQAGLAVPAPFQQELHREGGLARSGLALDEIHPIACESSPHQLVEPNDAR